MKHFFYFICIVLLSPFYNVYPQNRALICGAGGFIGSHLAKRLKQEGYWVRGVDIKYPDFCQSVCDEFIIGDLRDPKICQEMVYLPNGDAFTEIYQLAADMGGMGYISIHDAQIMHNSVLINLNVLEASKNSKATLFFSSSACVYPEYNQLDPQNPKCSEESAYPASPDTAYGWEKLFSERMYRAYAKDYGLKVRIARFHNIFGPEGTWDGGKEKAPAALCRKVAQAQNGETIKVWGKGDQTRSFLYIDECIEGVRRLMKSDVEEILNIGSEEMISINDLASLIAQIAGKKLTIQNIPGPEGVRGRNSDNTLIQKILQWSPSSRLQDGLSKTYTWIQEQVETKKVNNECAK